MDLNFVTVFMRYGEGWRAQRRIWHQLLRQEAILPSHSKEVYRFYQVGTRRRRRLQSIAFVSPKSTTTNSFRMLKMSIDEGA